MSKLLLLCIEECSYCHYSCIICYFSKVIQVTSKGNEINVHWTAEENYEKYMNQEAEFRREMGLSLEFTDWDSLLSNMTSLR